jgi:hypothetical protein
MDRTASTRYSNSRTNREQSDSFYGEKGNAMNAKSSPAAPAESLVVANGTAGAGSGPKRPVIRVAEQRRPVDLPLVPSDQPGSVDLTAERIAEIL